MSGFVSEIAGRNILLSVYDTWPSGTSNEELNGLKFRALVRARFSSFD